MSDEALDAFNEQRAGVDRALAEALRSAEVLGISRDRLLAERDEEVCRLLRGEPKPTTITLAQAHRIIALLERIEARLGGRRAA